MANLSAKTGHTPVQTRISLANNTTTTVQNFSAYDGIRLSGFVYVDATTDKRATVEVWVLKNGAGTYEIAAAEVAGDDLSGAAIVTFSMSGTSLIATLPNFPGFASAYIQYHLSAPQLGATFPLTVDGSNVTLATSTVQGAYKAGQAPGLTTGAAIPAGYVGEVIEPTTPIASTTSTTSESDVTNASLPLTAGVWQIFYSVTAYYTTGASSGNTGYTQVTVTDSFNVKVGRTERIVLSKTTSAVANDIYVALAASCIVRPTSTTAYKLRTIRSDIAGTGSGGVLVVNGTYNGTFYAIRIA